MLEVRLFKNISWKGTFKKAEILPVTNGEIDPATGLPFVNLESLFFVETIPMSELDSEPQFKNM